MGTGRVAEPVIYDISPLITARLAVFPGDVGYQRDVALDFGRGHHLMLSSMRSTMHLGAHADAPNHYHPEGQAIDARPLELYLGRCQVVSVALPRGRRVLPADVAGVGAGTTIDEARVIFRTGSFPDPDQWNDDFNALSPELVAWLAGRGVRLVGIDTPSIDLANDRVLESHQEVFRHDMAILEGLVLDAVPDGRYTLIALPLRLAGADASPVRAVLVTEPGQGGQ